MNQADAIHLLQGAMFTVLLLSGPAVAAAMAVGIVVALFQAVTQVQEMTLTFVPKIIAMLLTLCVAAPFIGAKIYAFTQDVYSRIETGF
ncbi:MAG: flagellar biosynthesis protein FliQ [Methylocystis sp.]